MNWIRFRKVNNNIVIINAFKSDINNIANMKTQHYLITTTIANTFLKFELINYVHSIFETF